MPAGGVCSRCGNLIRTSDDRIVKRFEYRGRNGQERFKSLDLAHLHRSCAARDFEEEARGRDDRLFPLGKTRIETLGQEKML